MYDEVFKVEGNSISLKSDTVTVTIVREEDFDVLFAAPQDTVPEHIKSEGETGDPSRYESSAAVRSLAEELIKEVFGCYYEFNDR